MKTLSDFKKEYQHTNNKWQVSKDMFLEFEAVIERQKKALELAREALSYEIGFIEDHCNEDDKYLLLDKQALEAIEEALK